MGVNEQVCKRMSVAGQRVASEGVNGRRGEKERKREREKERERDREREREREREIGK